MSFVDNEDSSPTFSKTLAQKFIDGLDLLQFPALFDLKTKTGADKVKKLIEGEGRVIIIESNANRLLEVADDASQQRRFAGPGLADERNIALPLTNAIEEAGIRFFMPRVSINEPRV